MVSHQYELLNVSSIVENMVQINFLVFFAFKFCCKVLELSAADSVISRASTASV
jgi:hypothetical protein